MKIEVWLAFFVASWLISLSPGAGAVAAMTSGLNYGFRRGYWTTLGLIIGIWFQVAIVAIGLGAILAASEHALTVIKWLGAAYLVWLGIQQWRAPVVPFHEAPRDTLRFSASRLVRSGFVVNALNPKGTVFLLAVMPQFLDASMPLVQQYLIIAATLAFTDLVVMGGYTALAAKVLRLLRAPAQIRLMNRVFGSLFVGAAAILVSFKRQG